MPYNKYSWLIRLKLWLYFKLSKWYINWIYPDVEEKGLADSNRQFRMGTALRIYEDFGDKCKEFCPSCGVCQAYLALEILADLYYEERCKPILYNLDLHKKYSSKGPKFIP